MRMSPAPAFARRSAACNGESKARREHERSGEVSMQTAALSHVMMKLQVYCVQRWIWLPCTGGLTFLYRMSHQIPIPYQRRWGETSFIHTCLCRPSRLQSSLQHGQWGAEAIQQAGDTEQEECAKYI